MLRFLNLNNSGFRPEEAARNLALKKHKFFDRITLRMSRRRLSQYFFMLILARFHGG
jgi:ABC-type Fe3+ transport system permease subunit